MLRLMTRGKARIGRWPLAHVILAFAAAILSFNPVEWLIETWVEPAYESKSLYVIAGVAALLLWGFTCKSAGPDISRKPLAPARFAPAALVRLIGQELAVNMIGALALVIDVYALGVYVISRGLSGNVRSRGVRVLLAGTDVLADLPCSGAHTLLLVLLLGFCLLGLFRRHKQEILPSTRSSADPAFQPGSALP